MGAAYVGFLATWWMGVLVFIPLGLFGFLFPTPKLMAINLGKAFLMVMFVALLTGLAGLTYGYLQVNQETVHLYAEWVWPGVSDSVQFVRVGFMHNASYLGGVMGLAAGILFLIFLRKGFDKYSSGMPCCKQVQAD
jgi:hypothetical protein